MLIITSRLNETLYAGQVFCLLKNERWADKSESDDYIQYYLRQ